MMTLKDTTIRDYGGGWNVSDSDLNLSSRFQPISTNVVRGTDGSFSVRMGTELSFDFETGTATDRGTVAFTASTVNGQPKITLLFPAAHGLSSGNHITISGATTALNGIPAENINGTHGIIVIDADEIHFFVDVAATSTGSAARSYDVVTDNHVIGGNIIHMQYFNRKLLVFTDIGEVGTADADGNLARIWGISEANALSAGLVPTRRCDHWSSDTFKSTVIACNGYNKDKPIQIMDDFTVEFLVDKATSSNAAVPKADFVKCLQKYVIFLRTEYGDPFAEFSAKGTDGTFTREASPADSVEVDLSMITGSVEPVILGAAQIREKLFVAFYDKGMIGTLGIYDGSDHDPDFSDTIAENGTISHRTMISLGNDVFMCDYAGVPSVTISNQSGIFVPTRLSELITPAIQPHLARMTEDTLRQKAFAVFSKSDRTYMLFIPVYEEITQNLPSNPFLFNDQLRELNYAYVVAPNHGLIEDTYVTIAGSADIGTLGAADINGVRRVVSVVNVDTFVVELGGAPVSSDDTYGGGDAVTFTPVNDETLCYAFEYNKDFRIKRWTLHRGWNFDCGAVSQRGRVFLAKGSRVYRLGNYDEPLFADYIGDYEAKAALNTFYPAGTRILENSTGLVFINQTDFTSPGSGNFVVWREADPDNWEEYIGMPIKWELETPWSDMQQRARVKAIQYVNLDTEGYDAFTLSAFTNNIRRDPNTNELIPNAQMQFQAGTSGGFGIQLPGNFGGGRRTREEKVWPFGFRGKLIRWRYSGNTTKKVRIISHTMYYKLGGIR